MRIIELLIVLFLLLVHASGYGQPDKKLLNDPEADAEMELVSCIRKAAMENKNIFIRIGGNWCSWCYLFHQFCRQDARIDSVIAADYITLKANYSRENSNKLLLARLGYTQRLGFPVFVILDKEGKTLHIQDSSLLEEGKDYNPTKVLNFFNQWTAEALDPAK